MTPTNKVQTFPVAELVYARAKATIPFTHYTGILTLNSLGRLALAAQDMSDKQRLLEEAQKAYQPFIKGKAEFSFCNFENYRCGGNGAAYLWWKGALPEADESTFLPYIEELLNEAPRNAEGILCHPKKPDEGICFIDIAFAVVPFLLYCGLALERDDLVHQAWLEASRFVNLLKEPETGLVNQAVNFRHAGHRTTDHWSRGNGWAIHALAALVESMPESHPDRPAADEMFVSLVDACLKFQDAESGLWHQEMTMPESYTETSGSGLILHAIGVGIKRGLLGKQYREAFEKGLRGYLSYIAQDGSVHNTCIGCLCPNEGTPEDYANRHYKLNDPHAFGPAIFTLAQAYILGIKTISL